MSNTSSEALQVKILYDEDGNSVAIKMDYIDFMLILHEGRKKNTPFFNSVLESLEKIEEEHEDTNDEEK